MPHLTTDVLIVGAGGAGMYAAIAAARKGASVILLDKSLVVAAALRSWLR